MHAAKLHRRAGVLLDRLIRAGLRQARMLEDFRQPSLVLRRVKAAVEGCLADAAFQTSLQVPRLLDHHVSVVRVARHQVGVADEAGAVFVDQHLPPELHRLCGFASLVQLGMRLEDAQQLVPVGHLFALKHTSAGRAANVKRSFQKRLQLGVQGEDFDVGRAAPACTFSQ